TILLSVAITLCGILGFRMLPVAPLPQVDFPVIMVSASLPGASPETMASSVATPLERSLGRIAGVSEMTSSSSLGSTRIILQFDFDRDINGAARDVGWHITVHAGEAAGPESIWQAIRELGAERIGHGVKAIEDRALMDFLAEQQIGIESCLTSNIQTSTVAELAAHPLKTFLEHGIRASINTDDPGVQGVDIIHEYTVAAPAAGLSREQIRQAQINGLEMAFLSAEEKRALREKVAAK
ncbi:efflux RND transporter permease subunit, partial [Escherichia coli]|nr:efflux RND transporter permease subunit [Escherichia coli]